MDLNYILVYLFLNSLGIFFKLTIDQILAIFGVRGLNKYI